MTIIQMQYFYEVCRCGNITKAALNLRVAANRERRDADAGKGDRPQPFSP